MSSQDVPSSVRSARASVEAGRYEEAFATLNALAAVEPVDPEVFAALAYAHAHQKNCREAIDAIGRAIDVCATEPEYFFARALYCLMIPDASAAIADASRVLELSDLHGFDYYREAAYLVRAQAHVMAGNCDAARRDCEHFGSDAVLWLAGGLRSKQSVLADCDRGAASADRVEPPTTFE